MARSKALVGTVRRARGTSAVAVIAAAVLCIAGGTATVVVGASGATGATPVTHHDPARPHALAARGLPPVVIPPAPVVIPPAPSSTAASPAPGSAPAGAAPGRVGAARPRVAAPAGPRVVPAGLPVGSAAPRAVADPSVVATALVRTLPLYASPGAPVPTRTLPNPNNLGARIVLLVTGSQPGWVEAYVPMRPNEVMAWIPAADVSLSFVTDHVVIHLASRTLVLYHDNAPVWSAPVAPGARDAPTPTGSFFIAYMVRVTDPSGPYGPYAMGTSAFSGTYTSFDGGPGQIGIHGTDEPSVIGTYASHGCIRLYNKDITTLAQQVVPGTPVEIEN